MSNAAYTDILANLGKKLGIPHLSPTEEGLCQLVLTAPMSCTCSTHYGTFEPRRSVVQRGLCRGRHAPHPGGHGTQPAFARPDRLAQADRRKRDDFEL